MRTFDHPSDRSDLAAAGSPPRSAIGAAATHPRIGRSPRPGAVRRFAAVSRLATGEIALLALMLAPLVISAGVALAAGWTPTGDAGYFTARSLDVLGPHHPLVGAFSSYSWNAPQLINNLGPIQLVALAPFTHIAPAAGTAVGTATVNALAIIAVWAVVIRRFGSHGRFAVGLATVAILTTFGGLAIVDPRQQVALLLPFWAFVWLTVLVVDGVPWACYAWIAAGSYVVQTHLSYAYLVAVLLGVGFVGFVTAWWARPKTLRFLRTVAGAVVFALALWSHTIWEQVAGSGNLGHVLANSSANPRGLTSAVRLLGNGPFGRLSYFPGSVDRFAATFDSPTTLAWPAMAVWAAAVMIAVASCVRHSDGRSLRVVLVGAAILVAVILTAYRLPITPYPGTPTENYLWMWPASLAALLAIAAPLGGFAARAPDRIVGCARWLAVAAALLALVTFDPAHMGVPDFRYSRIRSEAVGSGWYGELSNSLEELDVELVGPVLVTDLRQGVWVVEYAPLVALIEHGVDVRFPAGSPDLARFGAERCESGDERWRVELGTDPRERPLDERAVVLADGGNLGDESIGQITELRNRLATSIETGSVRLARDGIDALPVTRADLLDELRHPQHPDQATSTIYWMTMLDGAGGLTMTADGEATYAAWVVAEFEVAMDGVTVVLTPNEPSGPVDCDA